MAGVELPLRAVREQIARAFDLIVHLSRLIDGCRRVSRITEVFGSSPTWSRSRTSSSRGRPTRTSPPGQPVRLLRLECTGLKPHFLEKMAANGVVLPPTFFGNTSTCPADLAAASFGGFE